MGWGQITFHWLELGHLVTGSGQCLAVTSEEKPECSCHRKPVSGTAMDRDFSSVASSSCGEKVHVPPALGPVYLLLSGDPAGCGGHSEKLAAL